MRGLFLMLAGIGSLGLVASGAAAGTLAQADLSVTFSFATATFSRTAADGLSGSSTASTATFDAGSAFAGLTATAPIQPPTTAVSYFGQGILTKISYALGPNGLVQVTGGGVNVSAPLAGTAAFANASGPLGGGGIPYLTVPLSLGAGSPASPHVVTWKRQLCCIGPEWVTLSGTGWHLGAVTAQSLTASLKPIANVSTHGSVNLTPNGGGTVKLVTLTRLTTSAIWFEHSAGVTTLTLTFLPEPGSLALLGVAALGLVAAGRRRRT